MAKKVFTRAELREIDRKAKATRDKAAEAKALREKDQRKAVAAAEARKQAAKTAEQAPSHYEGSSGGSTRGRDSHHVRRSG